MSRHRNENLADRLYGWFFQGGWMSTILPVLLLVSMIGVLVTGNSGMAEINPGEVAVRYNTITGNETVVTQQGLLIYFPLVERVEVLSLEPQVFTMQGSKVGRNLAPYLRVRASDGSMFNFPKLETHYQIDPARANDVIRCFGRGKGYTDDVIPTYAREIYRNEFGRYSFLDIADPSSYNTATSKAKAVINEALTSCGIRVSQIITPKPDFDDKVEADINARQTAEQAVEVEVTNRERLVAEQERLVQVVRTTGNAEFQSLSATLTAGLEEANNDATAVRREADIYAIQLVAACSAERDAAITRAAGNATAYRKDAEGLVAQIKAVGEQGPDVLNIEIAKHVIPQLVGISARPYARSSQPFDIRTIQSIADATDGK